MKQSLQLKLSHSLTMTPQLQQAIRLLQLSSAELHGEIQEALDSNMMLELDEGEGENPLPPTAEAADAPAPEPADTQVLAETDTIPDELPVDTAWDDIYDSHAISHRSREAYEYNGFENRDGSEKSLAEHLRWQLNLSNRSETDRAIAIAIIDSLDDDGYLTCSLEDIHATINLAEVGLDEIEAVLHMVQALDPTGIGARNLQECLHLQLNQCDDETPWLGPAKTLVSQYLPLLAAHDYNQLIRKLGLERAQLVQVIALIQSLNPPPRQSGAGKPYRIYRAGCLCEQEKRAVEG